MTLDQILSAEVIGNAHSDADLLNAIHQYVVSDAHSRSDKMKALAKLDEVMGLEPSGGGEADLDDYIAFAREDMGYQA